VGLVVLLQLKTQQQQQQQHHGSGQQHLRFADDGSSLNVAGNSSSSSRAAAPNTPNTTSPFIAIANTHVLFNPRRGDVKVAQLRLLIKHLQALVAKSLPPQQQQHVAALVVGDLNHQPHTAVYQFMSKGWVDCLRQQRKNMAGGWTTVAA
jgi:mRNA deadenylase 3'-5' endonuclease subunit Ccr4